MERQNDLMMAPAIPLIAVLLVPGALLAGDWPQWRGPSRDGVVPAAEPLGGSETMRWPRTHVEEWSAPAGEGHSSPVVLQGKVFIHGREGEDEVLRSIDLETGNVHWTKRWPAPYELNADAASHGKGPKSTPAAAHGKLYTLGIAGDLSSRDAATGELVWRKEFSKEFPKTSPLYGAAASPLVEGELCIVHVGGHDRGALRAFDARTGAVKWSWEEDGPGYASPVRVDLAGRRQVATQTQGNVVGLSLDDGKLLWRFPFKTEYDQNSVTVLPHGENLVVSGYNQPLTAHRVAREGERFQVRELWKSPDVSLFLSSPVRKGSLLFGLSARKKGQVACVDLETGKVRWQGPGRVGENASLVVAGESIFVLSNEAVLTVLAASPAEHKVIAAYTVAPGPTWAHLAVSGKRILVKDRDKVRCLKF